MKKLKRIFSLMLCAISVFSLASCSGGEASVKGFALSHFDGSETEYGTHAEIKNGEYVMTSL